MKRVVLVAGALAALAAAVLSADDPAPAKLVVLEDILRSKNDNDPRLDRDFDDLSPETKRLFRRKYRDTAFERRNERGTIVYLLGRNLRSREDWEFLRGVALEPPCLSLGDCSKKPSPGADEEAAGDEVTLAYPSLVALRQACRAAAEARAVRSSALDVLAAARNSTTRVVARAAASLVNEPFCRRPDRRGARRSKRGKTPE